MAMAKRSKRDLQQLPDSRRKSRKYDCCASVSRDPYPYHLHPTPEECFDVREKLLAFHGFPEEFSRYRRSPSTSHLENRNQESVLDGLIMTLLSQNTTDSNSKRAFASLKSIFPTWEAVLAAETKYIENAIKCGGLASTKASCIKNILEILAEKKGKICLEHLRGLSIEEVKAELQCFKGVGPKTVACVLLFYLQKDDFPVDTHVFRIAKRLGWVPLEASREKAYLHLNMHIPNELKFDLNCLLFTHGKLCSKCSKNESKEKDGTHSNPCPLTSSK